ncbi:uncharacterized protein LOC132042794 isoform X2 [Lycium ferocissimum]|uniref:uncharacterized protein LOC132042794 isoform X2 n=1 Tax=Lycium ferocissimum TaxID=112874 RepID=UPI0028165914|nr:uncharacterized protein LOC132042794 isoform X2 [Lycium ferocissimum]
MMEGKVEAISKELHDNNGIHCETKLGQEGESVTQEIIQVHCDDKISEEEKKKISLVRALVEKQDPSSKEVDDFAIRRFLRARDLDVDKASRMLLKYLKWKKSFVPNGFISPSEIPNEIAQNKMFMQGVDKLGRPIAVVFGGRHMQNKIGGFDEFKRFVVLVLDKLCSRTSPGREKFVAIADIKGFGYANSDARAYIGALSILQIIFVENKRLTTTLLQDIDESQLPEIYGGKMPLVPIHEA